MKLLFDCTELSYFNENSGHRAGVFYVALNLLNEFKKRGLDITLVCDYKRYYFVQRVSELDKYPLLKEYSLINKFWGKVIYLSRNCPQKIRYAILIMARYYDKYLYKKNKKNSAQLESFDAYFSPYTPPSKEIAQSNLKHFRMIHDVIPLKECGMTKSPRKWYYKIYSSINSKDFYFANSECTRNDVLKYFPFIKPESIKTTLLGVNDNFSIDDKTAVWGKYKIPERCKYVFSLCTLGKRKNITFAIKNFIHFIEKNKINDLYLVLGGSSWRTFEAELNNTLKKYERTKIILTGYIKDEDLPSLYSNALMFVYPSLYEGFGLPVLEAMKCGCPVITSNVSSLPEIIGNAGIKINPQSDEELIGAYEKMYFDNFFRELCKERGIIRAREFSWEKCASEILDFISEKMTNN